MSVRAEATEPHEADEAVRLAQLERRLSAEERKLAAVRELSRALGATLDLDRLLVLLLDKATELLGAERGTLYLVSESGEELVSKLTQGGGVQEIRLRIGEGVAGSVARTGETINLANAYEDPRFQKDVDQRTGFHTRSMLCVPMPNQKGRTVGVIQLLNKRAVAGAAGDADVFDADDASLLNVVAAHAGIAIENSKLYLSVLAKNSALIEAQEELKRKVEDLDLLVEIQREASASGGIDELLDRLLLRAMQLVPAEAGAVLLREEGSGGLFFRAAKGGSPETRRIKRPITGVVGWAANHAQPAIVNDPAHDARHDAFLAERLRFPPRNIVAAPLLAEGTDDGRPLGAIELLNRVGRRGFDEADLKLLTLIAGHASQAIQLARVKEDRLKQDRLAAIGQMLSGVMHDLKTPMTIISGYVQLMAQSDDPQMRQRSTELILKQLDHLAAMTKEVLSFARGESNLLVRKVYLHKFLSEIEEHLKAELATRNVTLEIDPRFTGVAWFDELKLHRVVQNIARNAVQAMPDGGVFRITVSADDRELHFDFSDRGTGIPAELEGRLFQLFATAGKAEGTGLGLAIVKKIVDEHGGKITYTSRPGDGTTFHLALPLKREGVA